MVRPIPDRCPCDAGRSYDQCCGPFHRGEREAPDAPSLMRSRYSAFVRGDEDYLLRTLHPDHADLEEGVEAMRASLRDTFRRNRYEGLRVLDHRPAGSDGLAEVLFHARVREGGVDRSFVERSYFAHDGAGWRYLAGDLLPAAALKGRIEALTRGQSWALVLAATFTMTISYIDRQALAVLAPTITRELRLSETQYGLLASAFSLAYLIGAPFAGRWIDRVGARRGLLAAVLVWTVAAGLHALAPGFGALVVFRVLLGFAESPSFPGASQVVHRALSPGDRPRGVGVLFTGSSIGSMIAPPIAVALLGVFGWRGALLVSALSGLVWVPLWMGVAWRSPGREVLDAAPEPAELTAAGEAWSAWRSPAVRRTLALIIASSPAIGFVLTWSAKYLVRAWGVTQVGVAAFIWLPPLMFDVGSVAFGDLSARLAKHPSNARGGTHPALIAASASLAVGATLAMTAATSPWMAMGFAGAAMFGGGGTYAMITADMLARIPARGVSTAGGWCASAQALAFVVANPLIGRGVEAYGGYGQVLAALALWVVPGTLAWLVWPRVPPVRAVG